MPTRITFTTAGSGVPLTLDVAEEPDRVRGAFIGSAGKPFCLTDAGDSRHVYINPPSIAFWTGYAASPRQPMMRQGASSRANQK